MRTFLATLLIASTIFAGYMQPRAFTNTTSYTTWSNTVSGAITDKSTGRDCIQIVTAKWTLIWWEVPEAAMTGTVGLTWSKLSFLDPNGNVVDTNAAAVLPMNPSSVEIEQGIHDPRGVWVATMTGSYVFSYMSGESPYEIWDTNKLFFTPNIEVRTKLSAYTSSRYVTTVAKPLTGAWLRVNDTYWTNQANGYMLTNGPDAWTIYAANWTTILCSNAPQSVAATRAFTNIAFIHEAGVVISAAYPIVFNITTNTYTTRSTNVVDATGLHYLGPTRWASTTAIDTWHPTGLWWEVNSTWWTNEQKTMYLTNMAATGWCIREWGDAANVGTNIYKSGADLGFTNVTFTHLNMCLTGNVGFSVHDTTNTLEAGVVGKYYTTSYTNWGFFNSGYFWTNTQLYAMTGTATWREAHLVLTNTYAALIPDGVSNTYSWVPANATTWMLPWYVKDNYTNRITTTLHGQLVTNLNTVTIESHNGYILMKCDAASGAGYRIRGKR